MYGFLILVQIGRIINFCTNRIILLFSYNLVDFVIYVHFVHIIDSATIVRFLWIIIVQLYNFAIFIIVQS